MKCETSSKPRMDLSKHVHPRAVHVEIMRFVRGIRGERKTPVTKKAILKWLASTPEDVVYEALMDLVSTGVLSASYASLRTPRTSKHRTVVYEIVKE